MRRPLIYILFSLLCLATRPALADQRYDFHENVHVGQSIRLKMDMHRHYLSSSTTAGVTTHTDIQYRQILNCTVTVLAEQNGSATQIRVAVDPDSQDSQKDADGLKLTDCSFAGKTVTLRRKSDDSVANDFSGQPDPTDLDNLNSLLNPDEDFFPARPVAVGEVWDASAKVARHSELSKGDELLAQCRLDSVNTINGKQIGQISCSCGVILQEDGNVEEDLQWTATMQVDIAQGQIISSELKGTSTFSNPETEPTHVTGSAVFDSSSTIVSQNN
jgi:hypothetical protein